MPQTRQVHLDIGRLSAFDYRSASFSNDIAVVRLCLENIYV